jgi:class 3 adenylate cyclase
MLRQDIGSLEQSNAANEMITFEKTSQYYCVGVVDIVNSTQHIARLSQEDASTLYSTFLNTVGYVIQNNGGQVVKNMGDGILFYFPKQSTKYNDLSLKCGTKILEATKMINDILKKRKIRTIHYRVSLDYGPIMIAKYSTSSCVDIFGPTVNVCAKINHLAKPDQLVIGSDLFQIIKKTKDYQINEAGKFQSALKQDYSIYSIDKI